MRPPAIVAAIAAALGCVAAAPGAKPPAGEQAFQKCYACHSLEGPDPATQGPSLKDVVGREVASEAGYAYSTAMQAYAAKQPIWTREALEAFIADPQAVVPGNEMGFFGIADPEERHALVEYLAAS